MTDLLLAQCDPKAALLDADTRTRVLAALPGWLPDPEAKLIGRRFGFANFYQVMAFVDSVAKAKPAGAKGTYIQRVAISSTMGPGVKIEPNTVVGG